MKYFVFLLICSVILLPACKKSANGPQVITIEQGLRSNFGYQPGTYWIYKDSVTGQMDSAYVTNTAMDSFYEGCVLRAGEPMFQGMNITVMVNDNNPADTERWFFSLVDSSFSMSCFSNKDSVESMISMKLFTYPFVPGAAINGGCVMNFDSGAVTDIIPLVVNKQNFTNTARSAHASMSGFSRYVYNDYFYVNQDAGLVKVVMNHPQKSVYRVLELVRYHLVR